MEMNILKYVQRMSSGNLLAATNFHQKTILCERVP